MFHCTSKCCIIKNCDLLFKPFEKKKFNQKRRKKAGVFIFDPEQSRVLLVRSRGDLFGAPKGSIEENENIIDCALRELKEETGLILNQNQLLKEIKIKNRSFYFYSEIKTKDDVFPEIKEDNDVNGITWIKIDCLEDMIKNGLITLNQDCKFLFKKFLNISFMKSEFTKIKKRKSKSLSKKNL